ncbi:MAG: prepilin-type N-terminal cleavage/methylation domain-containing protein [Candidatus Peregrinibacteria bacterium]|nr:prepilin-type N-terminal cleavage/methylation domain-containing protein [Candidatus Peregrinibacteria bacterium]
MLKNFKKILKNRGVTLVEVLVASSLFAIAVVVAGDILVSDVQLEKKTSIQNTLASEMRIILQQISSEIQNGTIDYDEYYSVCVLQNSCGLGVSTSAFYGFYNGVYGSRFYDPGKSLDGNPTNNPDNLGAECSFPTPQGDKECEVVYNLSVDLNTGQNPFTGDPNDANAFCENSRGACDADQITGGSVTVDKLFILDKTGTKKTMIAKKLIRNNPPDGTPDYALGRVVMNGKDYDQNGVMDVFSCADGYGCYNNASVIATLSPFKMIVKDAAFVTTNNITIPWSTDLTSAFEGSANSTTFVPITPLFATVKDIQFIIHPLEDPYKAYAEADMKGQPSVTIVITMGLSSTAAKNYPGIFPDITLQTTVAAGVTTRIDSYPPVVELKDADSKNWLNDMIESWPGQLILHAVP